MQSETLYINDFMRVMGPMIAVTKRIEATVTLALSYDLRNTRRQRPRELISYISTTS
jgi:hypothetical protein